MEINLAANPPIKIVAVGDKLVGKSCAIQAFVTSHAPIERHSTVFDSSSCEIQIDGSKYNLSLWDTTGSQNYHDLIKSCYKDAQIFLIFFSVIDPDSFQSATDKWYPELEKANPKALIIFVGNKIDQRAKSSTGTVVSQKQAEDKIQQQLKKKYLECSAITGDNLKHVFEYSVKQYLLANNPVAGSQNPKTKKVTNQTSCCQVI